MKYSTPVLDSAEMYETPFLLNVEDVSGAGVCVTGGSCEGDGDTDVVLEV